MNINPFIDLIGAVLSLYTWVIMGWMAMSWLISFDILNRYQPVVARIMYILNRLSAPPLDYIRRYMPSIAGLDLSPIILFFAMRFIMNVLYTYFYK